MPFTLLVIYTVNSRYNEPRGDIEKGSLYREFVKYRKFSKFGMHQAARVGQKKTNFDIKAY